MTRTSFEVRAALFALVWCAGAPSRVRAEEAAAPAPPPVVVPAPPPVVEPAGAPDVIAVDVRKRGKAEQVADNARAARAIELEEARRSSADLGQVLARSSGVSVRREGGLGSSARIAMAGLTDEQIPVFVDGVPIEIAGYPFGIANVPPALLERVELHQGVVPVRLGADALGGAIDLITERSPRGVSGLASYQGGSFDTHRLAGTVRGYHGKLGLFVRADAFFDNTRNDYRVRVSVPSPTDGSAGLRTIAKNNDAYRAGGGTLEAGVLNRSWAKRLTVRGFHGGLRKEIPHNLVMQAPYGEAYSERATSGATARYESPKLGDFTLSALLGYTDRRVHLDDTTHCQYDWFGRCTRFLPTLRGEIADRPYDQHITQRSVLARVTLGYTPSQLAQFLLSSTASATRRTGEDRALAEDAFDALTGRRELLSLVSGLEYQLDAWSERVQNIAFFKDYLQIVRGAQARWTGGFDQVKEERHRVGVGDGVRVRVLPGVFAKASYEWATRLPSPDQLFGNGVLIGDSQTLRPEVSHNVNLAAVVESQRTPVGELRGTLMGFTRVSEHLIFLNVGNAFSQYQNIVDARALGFEALVGWTSPGSYLRLDANTTWQSVRNRAKDGPFARFDGDRVPNIPYFFANISAILAFRGVAVQGDELNFGWFGNYVHAFPISFESLINSRMIEVPNQFVQTLSASLAVREGRRATIVSLDLSNLTNARVYDYFGAQRPGRAFFAKLTLEM